MSPIASYLVETSVTLLGVVAISALLVYGARKRGVGRSTGPLDLVGRLPLDGQRAVYLVRVGSTVYVIGGSESGLSKLGELAESDLGPLHEPARGALADVVRRALGGAIPSKQAVEAAVGKEHGD